MKPEMQEAGFYHSYCFTPYESINSFCLFGFFLFCFFYFTGGLCGNLELEASQRFAWGVV